MLIGSRAEVGGLSFGAGEFQHADGVCPQMRHQSRPRGNLRPWRDVVTEREIKRARAARPADADILDQIVVRGHSAAASRITSERCLARGGRSSGSARAVGAPTSISISMPIAQCGLHLMP